jgi:hypothetical protein
MNAKYAIYDDDGRITSVVSGPTVTNNPPESNAIEVKDNDDFTIDAYYVSGGQLTLYPDKPSGSYVFDYQAGVWVVDLALAKSHKWDEIKGARDVQEFGTFDWNGYTFQCDEVSQRRIQGAVQLANMDSALVMDWTLADNSVQTFTAADFIAIGIALAAHVNDGHVKSRQLRQQIDAATSEADIQAISW